MRQAGRKRSSFHLAEAGVLHPAGDVGIGVSLGATYIIAQHAGAGRISEIRNSLPQALWLALALGLAVGPICFGASPLLDLLQLDALTHAKSLAYLQAVAFGLPAAAVFEALRCHNQGIGVMRPFAARRRSAFTVPSLLRRSNTKRPELVGTLFSSMVFRRSPPPR